MLSTMVRKYSSKTALYSGNSRRLASAALLALTASFHPAQCFSSTSNSFVPRPNQCASRAAGGATNNRFLIDLRGGSLSSNNKQQQLRARKLTSSTSLASAVSEQPSTETMTTTTPAAKLEALRSRMKELDLDAYLVPSDDPHLSEYTPKAYMRRAFLTGFHGSAGTAVVSLEDARLWTDSRYWNEANLQLDPDCWTLMKAGQPKVDTITKHLSKKAVEKYKETKKPLRVGLDPFIHAATYPKELQDAFQEAAKEEDLEDVTIGEIDTSHGNLVDPVWGDARPPIPTAPFQVHPLEYAGKTYQEKVEEIRKEMEPKKATLAVFSTLDDVAYLLNVRAQGDIEANPVGIAYAIVSKNEITLYCDPKKVEPGDVKEHLKDVTVKPYDDILEDIKKHCEEDSKNKVWIEKKRSNYAISSVVPEKQVIDKQNAVTPMKACKNDAELKGMREAHIADGVAMAKFMAWLEHTIVTEGKKVSEVEIDQKLTGERAKQPGFKEPSFPTIAGVGSNGAIIHYRAKEGGLMKYLDVNNPILIDSGGQYTYGTTDVTRTWHFGAPTQEFVDFYSRVLKGNIGLDRMVFPENTPGFVLDVFARKTLWEVGKDYGHGTGHGVGAALNVHEGPMGISPRWANKEVLKEGMVLSNEPGYYEDGNFGIRIENLMEVQYVNPQHDKLEVNEDNSGDKKFLKFSRLTMIPIQKNLINLDLMTDDELDWLDGYHQEVWEKVSPRLDPGSSEYKWLERGCAKIERK